MSRRWCGRWRASNDLADLAARRAADTVRRERQAGRRGGVRVRLRPGDRARARRRGVGAGQAGGGVPEITRDLSALRDAPLDAPALAAGLEAFVASLTFGPERKRQMRHATGSLVAILDATPGATLQERWERVEVERWPRWDAGDDRPWPAKNWTWGPAALVLSRAVRPGWRLLPRARLSQWLGWLPEGHPLREVLADLRRRVAAVEWSVGEEPQRRAALLGLRVVLAGGHDAIAEITDARPEGGPGARRAGHRPA